MSVCRLLARFSWGSVFAHTAGAGYTYGVSGPFWHAAGSAWPLFILAVVAVEVCVCARSISSCFCCLSGSCIWAILACGMIGLASVGILHQLCLSPHLSPPLCELICVRVHVCISRRDGWRGKGLGGWECLQRLLDESFVFLADSCCGLRRFPSTSIVMFLNIFLLSCEEALSPIRTRPPRSSRHTIGPSCGPSPLLLLLMNCFPPSQIKLRCPSAHTLLEAVHKRWDSVAHLVLLPFVITAGLMNIMVSVTVGCISLYCLTGVHPYASALVMPLCISVYTGRGGMKGSDVSAWVHVTSYTVVAFITISYVWKSQGTTQAFLDKLYGDEAASTHNSTSTDSSEQSYVSMWSSSGLLYGTVIALSAPGSVLVSESFWQVASGTRRETVGVAMLLGACTCFALPFAYGTVMGLAGRSMSLTLSSFEVDRGLVGYAVAYRLMGTVGVWVSLLQVCVCVYLCV